MTANWVTICTPTDLHESHWRAVTIGVVSPIVQPLVTLAGVLLGAAATFTATAVAERAKWRRSQDALWDDRRLTAYGEYANALKEYVQLVYRLSATRGYPATAQPIDLEEGLAALATVDSERTVKWEAVLLLGSPRAVAAARSWHEAAWR
ncbi:hypothetical protein [Nocardia amikacinitolerans]|uniref:hypothetical protein n=1 Tax=Nocardia amikacinitolerans TaxID=756689 RepID=UPI0020A476A9|nr:hypothetical protein [Nocardia amikacinitolerans]